MKKTETRSLYFFLFLLCISTILVNKDDQKTVHDRGYPSELERLKASEANFVGSE